MFFEIFVNLKARGVPPLLLKASAVTGSACLLEKRALFMADGCDKRVVGTDWCLVFDCWWWIMCGVGRERRADGRTEDHENNKVYSTRPQQHFDTHPSRCNGSSSKSS
jgi:hypothetical protein